MLYQVNIPVPTKPATDPEQLVKLDLIEASRKPVDNIYSLFDQVFLALKNRRLTSSHRVQINKYKDSVEVLRVAGCLVILEVKPKREEAKHE